jgi:hypothetical protein
VASAWLSRRLFKHKAQSFPKELAKFQALLQQQDKTPDKNWYGVIMTSQWLGIRVRFQRFG